jgi:hypothetical protein
MGSPASQLRWTRPHLRHLTIKNNNKLRLFLPSRGNDQLREKFYLHFNFIYQSALNSQKILQKLKDGKDELNDYFASSHVSLDLAYKIPRVWALGSLPCRCCPS